MGVPTTELDQKTIDKKTERLPKQIIAKGRVMNLSVHYDFDTVDRWYIGYDNDTDFPKKRVFMFYEEGTLDICIMKAWRHFAEHKDEWRLV